MHIFSRHLASTSFFDSLYTVYFILHFPAVYLHAFYFITTLIVYELITSKHYLPYKVFDEMTHLCSTLPTKNNSLLELKQKQTSNTKTKGELRNTTSKQKKTNQHIQHTKSK